MVETGRDRSSSRDESTGGTRDFSKRLPTNLSAPDQIQGEGNAIQKVRLKWELRD